MAKLIVPSNKIFRPVHLSRHRYVAMKGSAGSGKSTDTAQQYIIRLMADKGRNLVCIRKSDITNRDSTYAELLSAINRMGASAYWESTLSPLKITCVNGNSIIFRGVNDEKQREKLKSITFDRGKLTDVWIEEATEITQDDFEIIDDRLRGELPDDQFYQIKMTFNPVSKNHWIKRQFFDYRDKNTLAHHSTYLDNRFIDKAYEERMERRRIVDPDGFRIYGLGYWGEVGGLILTNWETFECNQDLSFYDAIALGQDFGFNHANAILLLGYKDGDIFIIRELYEHGKDTSELVSLAEGKFPKDEDMWCDSAEPDRIRTWRKYGYRAMPVSKEKTAGKKYQIVQIDWLKQRRIYIDPSCIHTIKEISQWKWKRDQVSGQYLDAPVEFMDDAMAALRYGIERWRKAVEPTNINDQLNALRQLGI